MIRVLVDLTDAKREEIELFFALPHVAPALDSLAAHGRSVGTSLCLLPLPAPPLYQTATEKVKP